MMESGFDIQNKRIATILPHMLRLTRPKLLSLLWKETKETIITMDGVKGVFSLWLLGIILTSIFFLTREYSIKNKLCSLVCKVKTRFILLIEYTINLMINSFQYLKNFRI